MNKERINEIIAEGKVNPSFAKCFEILDEVAKFVVENSTFKTFAQSKAKNNFVSPTEMFALAYDFLNNTGKYEEYLKAKETKAKPVETKKELPKVVKPKKETTIFDLF